MDRSSYFLLDKTTDALASDLCSVVLCPEPLLSHTQNFPKRKTEREREKGKKRSHVVPIDHYVLCCSSLSLLSPSLCDSFMVHLSALIWVPFLTLFSKFNTSRIHMHNVMRDLLYEYEYYRAALGLRILVYIPQFELQSVFRRAHIIFGAINAQKNRKTK